MKRESGEAEDIRSTQGEKADIIINRRVAGMQASEGYVGDAESEVDFFRVFRQEAVAVGSGLIGEGGVAKDSRAGESVSEVCETLGQGQVYAGFGLEEAFVYAYEKMRGLKEGDMATGEGGKKKDGRDDREARKHYILG